MTNKSVYTTLRLQECEHVDPETPLVITPGVSSDLARELYHTDPAYVAIGGRVCLRKEMLTPDEAKAIQRDVDVQRAIQHDRAKEMLGDFDATFTRGDDGVWHTEVVTSTEV